MSSFHKGFTLLELLIVIGILAILSTAVVLVLNPAQLLAEARDSQRLSDLNSLSAAIALYMTTDSTPTFIEEVRSTATTTCGFIVCTVVTGTDVDGTGWVGVDLRQTTGGSPLAALPRDPVNNETYQYAYAADNTAKTFELDARLESEKFRDKMTKDGGNQNTCPSYIEETCYYETGTDPGLNIGGAYGFWTFDEGLGTAVNDSSGYNHNGMNNNALWVAGQVGQALDFDGANDYVDMNSPPDLRFTGAMTAVAWVNINQNKVAAIVSKNGDPQRGWHLGTNSGVSGSTVKLQVSPECSTLVTSGNSAELTSDGTTWYHVAGVFDPGTAVQVYVDGVLANENTSGIPSSQCDNPTFDVRVGERPDGILGFNGQIDHVILFKRALTAQEITTLYDMTK